MVAVVKQDVDPALVISIPRADIAERVGLGQALGQIDAVTVDMEFINPEIQHTLPEFPGPRVPMVEVKPQSEGVDLVLIVPGVAGRRASIRVLVHPQHGVQSKAVVGHHIQDDGDAPGMGFIDEPLE